MASAVRRLLVKYMLEQNVTMPAVTRQPNALTSDRDVVSRNAMPVAADGVSSAASSRRSESTAARAVASSRSSLRISSSRVAIRALAIAGVTVMTDGARARARARGGAIRGRRRGRETKPAARDSVARAAMRTILRFDL